MKYAVAFYRCIKMKTFLAVKAKAVSSFKTAFAFTSKKGFHLVFNMWGQTGIVPPYLIPQLPIIGFGYMEPLMFHHFMGLSFLFGLI